MLAFLIGIASAQGQLSRDGVFDYQWDTSPPSELITTIDIQKALIWSGFYNGMADGGFGKLTRSAAISWQQARGYDGTGSLSPRQIAELFDEGIRLRDSMKWTFLSDKSVGLTIPYPAALAEFKSVRPTPQGLQYFFEGKVNVNVMVIPSVTCSNLDALYKAEVEFTDPDRHVQYQARRDNWYVVSGANGANRFYDRAECRSTGTALFIISVPGDDDKLVSVIFTAFSNGLSVAPTLRISATPSPSILASQPGRALLEPGLPTASRQNNKDSQFVDLSGKTSKGKLALASGAELRPQDVFERVRGAVYIVKPDDNTQGSAVAISSNELLTNCHVVRNIRIVSIVRDGQTFNAEVVSRNADADRCVLRSTVVLPTWVTIRPFSDVKVGEHVYTIGAPRGLELTLAEGLVSSKRNVDRDRFIQTSAPISPGSSGGGLFDAWGNLIGITTFLLKDSQNLNFAVVAEDYLQ